MKTRRHVVWLLLTLIIISGTFAYTLFSSGDRPALGLDLQGGISVVKFPEEGQDLSALDTAVDIIRDRVDATGIAEPEVQRQGNTVVVDLPGVKNRDEALALIGQTAELRFRLVQGQLPWTAEATTTSAPAGSSTTGATVPGETATTAPGSETTTPADSPTTVEGDASGGTISTTPIAAHRPAQETTTPTTAAAETTTPTTVAGDTTTSTPPTTTAPSAGTTCQELLTPRDEITDENSPWLPSRDGDDEDDDPDACYNLGPTLLNGRNIRTAKSLYDQNQSGYIVEVQFRNDDFVTKIAQPYVNQFVAIELDGVVQSAPKINPGITGRSVVIEGGFSKGEASRLAKLLRYGALPIEFDQNEETVQSVSPTLGKDQLRAGIVAGLIGLGLVALYMILYYRLLGIVVWLGLGLTALVFFSLTSYLSANEGLTLTLAGVTGLIVSVGVTVDSYVVYFERLKDEVRTGKTIRSSLDTGFRRAFRTILAADLVSLLGAVVLYMLAAGSVRGFAFFLGLSTVIDLVLAYVFMHPLVALMSRRPALVRMRGIGIAAGLDVPEVRA